MKNLYLAILFLLPQVAFSKVLLVSDMDDTIKVSHVLDVDSAIANARQTKNAFMGMPELYQSLVKIPEATEFHYLSSAPRKLMLYLHHFFLWQNDFPSGRLVLNNKLIDSEHKITSLRKMIAEFNPTKMILIGDNGERDAEVYAQIRKEFPHIGGETYIHMAYSQEGFEKNEGKPLQKGQIAWATSIDLAYDLLKKGYITEADYKRLVESVESRALSEDPYVERRQQMMFPAWFDCRDFQVPVLPLISQELQTKIEDRCDREPYDD